MQSTAKTVDEYYASLPEERQGPMNALRKAINKSLPKGFVEEMGYGMPGWVVPHKTYPAGYHCNPKDPLPFMGLASQKQAISFYSMSLYCDPIQLEWFRSEWPKHTSRKLDMGKSCIRLKKMDDIPIKLLAELASKVTPKQWIEMYEQNLKR